jgi:hypothetical protein
MQPSLPPIAPLKNATEERDPNMHKTKKGKLLRLLLRMLAATNLLGTLKEAHATEIHFRYLRRGLGG